MRFFIWCTWLIYWLLLAFCGAIVLGDWGHYPLGMGWVAVCFGIWWLGHSRIERIK